ncbi:MAG TPA: hypothetical protein VK468_05900 [Pyrinomonadaceae bacterium]|nr:hypothetical protein [Pyrinomonadaceae bacterium]
MKICPTCRRTYSDDGLNFCLEDGTVLTLAPSEAPPTVMMNQPRPTDPAPISAAGGINAPAQPYSMKPKKSSKTWLWVVAILGLLLLVCGGGIAAMVGYVYTHPELAANNSKVPSNRPVVINGNNSSTPSASPSPSPFDSASFDTLDLSEWVRDTSAWGNTEFTNGEFIMSSKQKGYYYVLVAPEGYTTDGAVTHVTLSNIDNANSSMGYGLVFHSNPDPLVDDFAFLINTKTRKYRVVTHKPGKESTVVAWTTSPFIKDGTQENILEARDQADKTDLYINGQLITSVKNAAAYKNGVPGLYSGDAARIAFKNLEIKK